MMSFRNVNIVWCENEEATTRVEWTQRAVLYQTIKYGHVRPFCDRRRWIIHDCILFNVKCFYDGQKNLQLLINRFRNNLSRIINQILIDKKYLKSLIFSTLSALQKPFLDMPKFFIETCWTDAIKYENNSRLKDLLVSTKVKPVAVNEAGNKIRNETFIASAS